MYQSFINEAQSMNARYYSYRTVRTHCGSSRVSSKAPVSFSLAKKHRILNVRCELCLYGKYLLFKTIHACLHPNDSKDDMHSFHVAEPIKEGPFFFRVFSAGVLDLREQMWGVHSHRRYILVSGFVLLHATFFEKLTDHPLSV